MLLKCFEMILNVLRKVFYRYYIMNFNILIVNEYGIIFELGQMHQIQQELAM